MNHQVFCFFVLTSKMHFHCFALLSVLRLLCVVGVYGSADSLRTASLNNSHFATSDFSQLTVI